MELPDDIWKHKIYQYLDYDSRINLNRVMPPQIRGKKRFTKIQIQKHASFAAAQTLAKIITRINLIQYNNRYKYTQIKKVFRLMTNPLFQQVFHIIDIREIVSIKCWELSQEDTNHDKDRLNELLQKTLRIIRSYSTKIEKSLPISL